MTSKSKARKPVKAKVAPKGKKRGTKTKTRASASKATAAVSKDLNRPVAKGTVSSLRVKALEKMLIARRQEVMKEIGGLMSRRMSDEVQGRIDSAPDVGDQALLDSERGRDISILEMRNRVRQQIEEALVRLREGNYGLCADCGVEISEKRLKALPFARRCVACQEKVELLEKIEQEEDQTA
jgi:DnaK suppressor protein